MLFVVKTNLMDFKYIYLLVIQYSNIQSKSGIFPTIRPSDKLYTYTIILLSAKQ